MVTAFFQRILSRFIKTPEAKLIAAQLRKPSGLLGKKVGQKMNETNGFLYEFAIPHLKIANQDTILEIGFGNGKFFNKILNAAENLSVYGIDYAELMVKEAIANNIDAVKRGTLNLRTGNSNSLPYEDSLFDAVFCINVIYFWINPSVDLKEIYRILKPGGRFLTIIRTKQSMLEMPFSKYGFTLYDEVEWTTLLKKNAFTAIESFAIKEPLVKAEGMEYSLESLCIVAQKL